MACDSLLSRTGGRFSSRTRLATVLSLLVLVEMASPGCMWEAEGPVGQVESPIQHAESPFRGVQFPVTEADIPSGISPELRSLIRDTFSPDARTRADAAKTLNPVDGSPISYPSTKDLALYETSLTRRAFLRAEQQPGRNPCS